MMIASDDLLGRKVVDAHGADVGVVVDVGSGKRHIGFVLVGPAKVTRGPAPILRVDLDEVTAFDGGVLRLRPVPGAN